MRRRKIRDEADARTCLAAVQTAGGDRVAWSHAHGVDARSLNAWRVALRRRASSQKKAATRQATRAKLVELVPRIGRNGARYVVELGTARIEMDDGFSAETLQRLVRALRAC